MDPRDAPITRRMLFIREMNELLADGRALRQMAERGGFAHLPEAAAHAERMLRLQCLVDMAKRSTDAEWEASHPISLNRRPA